VPRSTTEISGKLRRVPEALDLKAWLRERCAEYGFGLGGFYHRRGEQPGPITATDIDDLEEQLAERGHLLPLPKEPAALANVLEVSLVDFLLKTIAGAEGLEATRGTERGYPDMELTGAALGARHHAVDVKVARRDDTRKKLRTQSRITLYTGNTYFKWPNLHWPGTFRPFDEYASHLDIIVIYTLNPELRSRAEDLEIIVQQPWRIASKQRSSTTREYIGAVTKIEDLREGNGEFDSPEAFYDYWRRFPFRVSPQVQRQLQRLLAQREAELAALRKDSEAERDPDDFPSAS
jgi:Restriction endonuclease EcoRV